MAFIWYGMFRIMDRAYENRGIIQLQWAAYIFLIFAIIEIILTAYNYHTQAEHGETVVIIQEETLRASSGDGNRLDQRGTGYCPQCGTMAKEEPFCRNCGTKL
ncbi:hypothetical protein SDC9_71853 [bioreactor metagenome]|uniref:Zinc-ribbon domain-containing protein n=1 Tax=bioreactor metagenome TaxID=1076179 RepID=A0A644Y9Q7_9ZZZZ